MPRLSEDRAFELADEFYLWVLDQVDQDVIERITKSKFCIERLGQPARKPKKETDAD